MFQEGEKHPRWKGDDVKHSALHTWMINHFPKTGCCENCGSTDRKTQWASIDHVYTRKREDWRELCDWCHRILDGVTGTPRNAEVRSAISEAKKGMVFSDAHKEAISAAKRGKPWSAARRAAHERSSHDCS